jgi:hypothetical protein
MTLAQAKNVASAVVDAGFNANIRKGINNEWSVTASSPTVNISVIDAANLATAQGVTGLISEVQYS